ncbi:MAG: glycosyltransferase family 4 protein [Acidobacteria bacterium]|nr:glycosyltransferase family 4 protein [Acidobacteriota bacterium]
MSTPVKILQIGNYPPPMCGWAIQTWMVTQELRRRGHVCEVLKINENRQVKDPAYIDVQDGWDYVRKVLRYAWRGYQLNAHLNGMGRIGYTLALIAVLAGRAVGRPALLTFHGGLPQTNFPRYDHGLWHRAFWLLFHLSGGIACDEPPVREAILRYGVAEGKVQAIATFSSQYVKFEKATLPQAAESFLQTRRPVIFSYVSFRPEYRLEIVRQAMRSYRSRYPQAGFLWLGFPEKELLQARDFVASWPEAEREGLLLLGNLTHDQFLTLLSRSTLYLRPPACDGVAASVLESLALGVPVVASENGRRPAGVVTYAETDSADMAAKLFAVTEHPNSTISAKELDSGEDNIARMADWLTASFPRDHAASAASSSPAGG